MRRNNAVIGLTGGIGTGKSTASKFLKIRGAKIIDADVIAREILAPEYKVLDQVIDAFGEEILDDQGRLKRKKLGAIIFSDDKKRKQLDQIMHPAIICEIENRIARLQKMLIGKIIIIDCALLFEIGYYQSFDETWVITTKQSIQLNRVMKRDNLSKKEAIDRLNSQMPLSEKEKLADIVINNNSTIKELYNKLEKNYNRIDKCINNIV